MIYLYLEVSIKTPRLTKIHHYTNEQKRVFKIVKYLKENYKYSYELELIACNPDKYIDSNEKLI